MEIRLLDPSTLALVQTWEGPAAESRIGLFSRLWQRKPAVVVCKDVAERPETMSEEEFAELEPLMTPRLRAYRLSADGNSLSVSWSYPLLSAKEAERVSVLLKPRVLTWNGTEFR